MLDKATVNNLSNGYDVEVCYVEAKPVPRKRNGEPRKGVDPTDPRYTRHVKRDRAGAVQTARLDVYPQPVSDADRHCGDYVRKDLSQRARKRLAAAHTDMDRKVHACAVPLVGALLTHAESRRVRAAYGAKVDIMLDVEAARERDGVLAAVRWGQDMSCLTPTGRRRTDSTDGGSGVKGLRGLPCPWQDAMGKVAYGK